MSTLAATAGTVPAREPVGVAIRAWLYFLAALVIAMILVGGATRLTDSGLSITEWKPVTGAIPPLSEAAWQAEFEKYKQIPEYQIVNLGMSLAEFKMIFWWEWGHRLLGRLIGIAFFVPFVFFWVRKQVPAWLMPRLIAIFILGGLQGALGWFMVMSGLVERVDVSQYRLTAHLGAAFVILAFILWTAYTTSGLRAARTAPVGQRLAVVLFALIFLQILLGALVAGLDAGLTYNTWPLMDGKFIPGDLFIASPWFINLFENVRTVQFDHRMVAYLVFAVAVLHALRLAAAKTVHSRGAWIVVALLLGQIGLGIWTLLAVVPIELGLAHQFGAVVVFAVSLGHLATLTAAR